MGSGEGQFSFDNWATQARKGLLELCILNALSGGERYGYELVKELVASEGVGVTEGTIYPLLSRLKSGGLLRSRLEESSDGPARKYYALTVVGENQRKLMNRYMNELMAGLERLKRAGGADE